MPRRKTFRSQDYPYHVTARSSNQEWFYIPMEQCWKIFSNYLWFVVHAFEVRVHAFVLMNNHFHLLIDTPNANIDEAMNYLLREVSKTIGDVAGRKNQIFGGPYHWSLIKNSVYYHHVYKYIYRNPVEAGLCYRVEDYRFSTIRGLMGLEQPLIPAIDNLCLIQNVYHHLDWLNRDFREDDRLSIKKALSHSEFSFGIDKKTGRASHLEKLIV